MVTIVFAHPWHGSFNAAILNTVITKLKKENRAYQLIDLHQDGFNPVMDEKELALFRKGQSPYPLTIKYQGLLKNTDEAIFIFPIWWSSFPAILKGFFDKVMLKGFAYEYRNNELKPLLNIPKTTVITTSESPTLKFKTSFEDVLIPHLFEGAGLNNVVWLNNEHTTNGTDQQRKEFLKNIEARV